MESAAIIKNGSSLAPASLLQSSLGVLCFAMCLLLYDNASKCELVAKNRGRSRLFTEFINHTLEQHILLQEIVFYVFYNVFVLRSASYKK